MLQPVRQGEPTDPWALAANLSTTANATASGSWGGLLRSWVVYGTATLLYVGTAS